MTDRTGDRDKYGMQESGEGNESGVQTSPRAIPRKPRAKRGRLPPLRLFGTLNEAVAAEKIVSEAGEDAQTAPDPDLIIDRLECVVGASGRISR